MRLDVFAGLLANSCSFSSFDELMTIFVVMC